MQLGSQVRGNGYEDSRTRFGLRSVSRSIEYVLEEGFGKVWQQCSECAHPRVRLADLSSRRERILETRHNVGLSSLKGEAAKSDSARSRVSDALRSCAGALDGGVSE